jgi:type VI protein secretion system component VasF
MNVVVQQPRKQASRVRRRSPREIVMIILSVLYAVAVWLVLWFGLTGMWPVITAE